MDSSPPPVTLQPTSIPGPDEELQQLTETEGPEVTSQSNEQQRADPEAEDKGQPDVDIPASQPCEEPEDAGRRAPSPGESSQRPEGMESQDY